MNTILADAARQGAATFGTATPAGARLEDMGQFLEHTGHDMARAAERWRQVFSARRTTDR